MDPQDIKGSVARREQDEMAWELALERLRLLGGFLRRRGFSILATGLLFGALAMVGTLFLLPVTFAAHTVVAVDEGPGGISGALRLPESGYRMLAVSEDVLGRLRADASVAVPGDLESRLRVRLLDPREVRRDGAARLFQLSVTADEPEAAERLADAWAKAFLEVESERGREAGRRLLETALEERRARQERRVREQEVRLRVAEEAASGMARRGPAELLEEERLHLAMEEAQLVDLSTQLEELRQHLASVHREGSLDA
ncbi:MAG: hypothetical protein KDD47_18485, partial [Acidobacteria bacterium]|nr:hypothetical protein [Acidobacteriota bacterium]